MKGNVYMDAQVAKKFVGKMIRVNRMHRSLIESYTKQSDLHRSQQQLLLYLLKCNTPPSQKDIAAAFEITPAAVAISLKKLEQRELIQRIPNPDDTRANLITISQRGKELLERNRELFEQTDAAMLEGVSEAELDQISRVLDKFIANLVHLGACDELPEFLKENKERNETKK